MMKMITAIIIASGLILIAGAAVLPRIDNISKGDQIMEKPGTILPLDKYPVTATETATFALG